MPFKVGYITVIYGLSLVTLSAATKSSIRVFDSVIYEMGEFKGGSLLRNLNLRFAKFNRTAPVMNGTFEIFNDVDERLKVCMEFFNYHFIV
jgi:hypothetical protein